ncbi:hypothetical protein MS3_00000088 [Schistosoma haematobium]|uniref:Uncharacterized protein n=1 Tax=Schistosoma haematobium TaxID=6185 RepID=A0A922LK74_SCHHA|nr:hypothetical protein MS3_00000088 [Schistosoma haematobium]KAH9587672.1 hypothetical protein MS3_00000088 [Schistosoma haematobium]
MPNCSFQGVRTARIDYKVVNELDIQSTKISNTLLSCHDEIQSQGQSDLRSFNSDSYSPVNMKGVSTWNNKANHKGHSNIIVEMIFHHPRGLCRRMSGNLWCEI